MPVTSVVKDADARTVTITARFDASIERVWRVWSDPRQLERWWGPPNFPATVTEHDLVPGGTVAYSMTGPEGDEHHGRLARARGRPAARAGVRGRLRRCRRRSPRPDLPTGLIRVALSELAGGRTQMVVTTTWASGEAMAQILATGTDAGMTAAVNQIDALLERRTT